MGTVKCGNRRVEEVRRLDVCFQEGGYAVRNIITEQDALKSYHLRHRIFCEELGWVPPNAEEMEVDDYDFNAVSFGVFDPQDRLAAYMRLIMPGEPFMMEKEFLSMVSPEHKIRREKDTAEISRLCIAPEARRETAVGDFGCHGICVVLLKGVYQWCVRSGIRYLYAVTEQKVWRLNYIKGFPFKLIGEPQHMPDGVIAVPVIMDWREFEKINSTKRPKLLKWFSQYQSSPVRGLSRQHGSCSRHPVFS